MDAKIAEPDWNDVALFVAVVRAASFSTAARERGVPVSTVSRRVARLEGRLGARLLERTTRRLRLTEVGERYFAHAERALDTLAEGNQQVRAAHAVPRGRVRITAPIGIGPVLTTVLAPYLAATPLVSIEIVLDERPVDLLASGVDIAVRSGRVDSGDFVARKLLESTRGLFASSSYVARRGRPKTVDDLTSHDLIATRSTATGAVWELLAGARKVDRHRIAFKPRLSVNEMVAARHATLAGIGIALLPVKQIEPGTLVHV